MICPQCGTTRSCSCRRGSSESPATAPVPLSDATAGQSPLPPFTFCISNLLFSHHSFLQGPATSSEAVDRVRQALNKGETSTNLLLNYARDGTAFYNLLWSVEDSRIYLRPLAEAHEHAGMCSIMPLRDSSGKVAYFLGGQVNVSGFLSSTRGLSFLIGGGHSDIDSLPASASSAQSPSMSAYLSTMTASSLNPKAYPLRPTPTIRKAAGEAPDTAYSSSSRPFSPPERKQAASGSGSGGPLHRMAQILGIKDKKSTAKQFEDGELYGKQHIVGAEGTLDPKGGGVEDQSQCASWTAAKGHTWLTFARSCSHRLPEYL